MFCDIGLGGSFLGNFTSLIITCDPCAQLRLHFLTDSPCRIIILILLCSCGACCLRKVPSRTGAGVYNCCLGALRAVCCLGFVIVGILSCCGRICKRCCRGSSSKKKKDKHSRRKKRSGRMKGSGKSSKSERSGQGERSPSPDAARHPSPTARGEAHKRRASIPHIASTSMRRIRWALQQYMEPDEEEVPTTHNPITKSLRSLLDLVRRAQGDGQGSARRHAKGLVKPQARVQEAGLRTKVSQASPRHVPLAI